MTKRTRHWQAWTLACLTALAIAPQASALPLYFEGPDGFGFDPADVAGMPIAFTVTPTQSFETAGDPTFFSPAPLLSVTTSLVGLLAPEPMPPTFATPLIAEVQYTVTNTTGSVLDNEWLLFTLGAVDGFPDPNADPDPWPFIEPDEFGLDSDGFQLVAFNNFIFGGILLPLLQPGEIHQFNLVHFVADSIEGANSPNPDGLTIPSPGLALVIDPTIPVPEPAPAALVLLAGVALARARRIGK